MKPKTSTGLIYLILLGCLPIVHAYADNSNSTIPLIEENCEFDPTSGHVNLSITNKGTNSVLVSPVIDSYHSDSHSYDSTNYFNPPDPGTIGASIVFIGPPRYDLIPTRIEGVAPRPIEVTPGETKKIILSSNNLINASKGAVEVQFYLFFNNQIIKTNKLTFVHNIWK